MSQGIPRAGFTNVDQQSDPRFYVRHLERQQAVRQGFKDYTFALLDLGPGQRVLDIGCGLGRDALDMARLVGPAGRVTGVDASRTMIDEARRRSREADLDLPVSFEQGDAHHLAFADDTCDRCRAERTFQHLPDPRRALAEMIRVTKPGGRLLIAEPDHETMVIASPYQDITRRFLAFRSDGLRQGGIAHQLYALFKEFGLAEVAVEARANVSTDYETAVTFGYARTMRAAQACGVVTEDEAERWIAALETTGRNGRFLSCATTFITTGRKPA